MINKVAVVTGSSKGLGYGIVKELCKTGVLYVYLTARDEGRGKKAINDLKKEGLHPIFHKLDVTDENNIKQIADRLKKVHGGIDILVNNAGIAQRFLDYDHIEEVINVNYMNLLQIQKHLYPLLKQNARVINISSGWGHIHFLRNPYWIQRLTKEDIIIEDVNYFVNWFLNSVKNQTLDKNDFFDELANAYKVSKIAMCALSRAQQRMNDIMVKNISINSLNPGYVKTDITKGTGHITVEKGIVTPIFLALDADQSVKGKYFWYEKSEVDWTNPADVLNIIRKVGF